MRVCFTFFISFHHLFNLNLLNLSECVVCDVNVIQVGLLLWLILLQAKRLKSGFYLVIFYFCWLPSSEF